MTEISKTVELKTVINPKGAISGAKRTKTALRDMRGETDKSAASFSNLKSKAVILAVAFASFRILGSVTRNTIEFTSAISDLSAITGATGADLKFLSDAAREMGASTTLSATQAAEAFKLVASAKPDLLENRDALKEVTQQAVLLAEASGSTLTGAAETVGAALNQYGAEADQAARFVNVLAAGSKFGASEVGATARALKEAGTVAATVGISFETTNAAIQQLANVSIKGSQAGTQLRNIFLKLSTQTDESINPSIVGLSDALINLKEKQLPLVDIQKLFGLESIAAAQALILQADGLGSLTEKLSDTNTALEQAKIKVNNLGGDLKKLDSAWVEFTLKIGAATEGLSRFAIQFATSALNTVGDSAEKNLKQWSDIFDFIKSAFGVNNDPMKPFRDNAPATVSAFDEITTKIIILQDAIKNAKENFAGADVSFMQTQLDSLQSRLPKRDESYLREQLGIGTQPLFIPAVVKPVYEFENNESFEVPGLDTFKKREREVENRQAQNEQMIALAEQQFFTEEERLQESYLRRNAIIEGAGLSEERSNELKLKNHSKYYTAVEKLEKDAKNKREKLAWDTAQTVAGSLVYITSVFAGESKTMFYIAKAAALAEAGVNISLGITKAWGQGGIFGAIGAAAVGLAGAAQIYKIASASPDSGAPTTGGGSGLSPSSVGDNAINPPPNQRTPDQNSGNGGNVTQVYLTVNGFTNKESVENDVIPALKDILNGGETLFDEDSAQTQLIQRAG